MLIVRISRNHLTFSKFIVTIFGLTFERREPDRGRKAGKPQVTR